jgi:hypothetical protein
MHDEMSATGFPYAGSVGAVDELLCELSKENGTALGLALLYQYGDWQTLRSVDVAKYADQFPDVKAFAVAYQAAELLRKDTNSGTISDGERTRATLDKWLATEASCRATNDRWAAIPDGYCTDPVLARMRDIVYDVLDGRSEDSLDRFLHGAPGALSVVEECLRLGSFGPGSHVGFPGSGTTLSQKYECRLTVTPELSPFCETFMPDGWRGMRSNLGYEIVEGNEWFDVLKNAVINRACAKEPAWNVWLQLGVGRKIRRLMKRVLGVDLSNQKMVNRLLVQYSYEWDLCTIDLSSASDLKATNMVRWFLPSHWFHLMDLARSHVSVLPNGEVVPLEKFCSMGNGFTFPLQTLLFTALVRAVVPQDQHCLTAVFGDDIIVPRQYAAEVIRYLEFLGLQVNVTKTHLAGGFRESCGVDVFRGVNVRPAFRRAVHNNDPIAWANNLRRWIVRLEAIPDLPGSSFYHRMVGIWRRQVESIPPDWRLPGPESLGDSVVHVPVDTGARIILRETSAIDGSFLWDPWVYPFPTGRSKLYLATNVPDSAARAAARLGYKTSTWEDMVIHKVVRRAPRELDRKSIGLLALDLHKRDCEVPHLYEQQDDSMPQADGLSTRGYEPIRGSLQQVSEKWAASRWPGIVDACVAEILRRELAV